MVSKSPSFAATIQACPNFELWFQSQNLEQVRNALLQAGAEEVHDQAKESFRIACGIPEFGRDIRERDLPQETARPAP